MPIELIDDTTFEVKLPGGDKVEIGDKDSKDFKPHLKLNRWDGECFIKVKMAGEIEDEVEYELEGDKVKTKYKIKYGDFEQEVETEFYPLELTTVIAKDKDGNDVEFHQNKLGGFEFEIILTKKPTSNKIVLDIETQGLKFYYQPPLTQEEIDEGCIRPDNVVGSYAVYHATRTNMHRSKEDAEKYKCGIAFHIYRPKITDANGKWVWGELSLNEVEGTLTTTIPQDFLDSAVYPVSTGTTNFGYETEGVSTGYSWNNRINGDFHESGGAGIVDSITIYVSTATVPAARAGLYLGSDATFIAGTEEDTSIGANDWHQFDFAVGPEITSQEYGLAGFGDGGASARWAYNTEDAPYKFLSQYTEAYPTWLSPVAVSTSFPRLFSIYCTFSPAGPAGIPVQAFMHYQRLRRA